MMIAWHYTTGEKYKLIKELGVLMPADIAVVPPELPIVWFSTHRYYDGSARKGIEDAAGRIRPATIPEMYEHGGGLVRLGCPIAKLKHGEVLRKAAKMQSIMWRRLLKTANDMGANSGDWWGYVGGSMPISDLQIEVMNSNLKWPHQQK